MRPEPGVDRLVRRGGGLAGEGDLPAAADAVAERPEAVGRRCAVAGEAAALAARRRLVAPGQRAFKVPSRSSSAFEVFCAAGSEALSALPGAAA